MKVEEIISAIQKRPKFFLFNNCLWELDAFIRGVEYYQFASGEPTESSKFKMFKNEWLQSRLGLDEKSNYIQCLMFVSVNSMDAFDNFFVYWNEFINEQVDD